MAGLLVTVLATYLVVAGLQMSAAVRQRGLGSCQSGVDVGTACSVALNSFTGSFFGIAESVRYVLLALPVLLGVFVAAPLLAREVEDGTHLFAWTQSITRTRWFSTTVLLLGAFTILVATALTIIVGWWQQPLEQMYADRMWTFFEVMGPVSVAYAVFALALGLAAGTVIQRTVPAMAATLFVFVGARAGVHLWRPWFEPPLTQQLPAPAAILRGALQIASRTLDNPRAMFVYQPADRFWTFQVVEMAIFLGLAIVLIALSVWWLRHRVH